MGRALPLLALLACSSGSPPAPSPEAALSAFVADPKVDAGEAVVLEIRASNAPGWTVTPGAPAAEGLRVDAPEEAPPLVVGDRQIHTWTFSLHGEPGSYVIQPGDGQATSPTGEVQPLPVPPIFVDIGVDGPTGGAMAGFEDPPPAEGPPWGLIAAGGVAALALAGGLGLWLWRRRQPVAPPPPVPPDVAALRDWAAARASGVDDHSLALSLSRILRVYLEAISGFPAPARTTREILSWLSEERILDAADRARAARVLDATDRLKFAREGGGAAFFDALDADFRAVIEATRPRSPSPSPEPAAGGAHV